MDFASISQAPELAAGRDCGSCNLCCKVYSSVSIGKEQGKWCRHCEIGVGCKIYDTRPPDCQSFFCLWRIDKAIPVNWKPDVAKFVITTFPGNGFIYVQVDPGSPQAWRKEPYFSHFKKWSEQLLPMRRHILVFVNTNATLIMPTGPVPIGPMSPEEGFVVRERFTATGKDYTVERAQQAPASASGLA